MVTLMAPAGAATAPDAAIAGPADAPARARA